MDRTIDQYGIQDGATVYGADGEKVGKIIAVGPQYVVVEKGFFFPSDYYIPASAIASADADNVYLTVTKDQALNSGWEQEPVAEFEQYDTTATAGTTWDTEPRSTAYDQPVTGRTDRIAGEETTRIPLREEELVARRREVERGEVRIEKDVTAQEQVLEVPVTEERVRVTRHAVDRDVTGADAGTFQDEVIEVPIHGEEVELEKRTRVAEEVEVGKERVQRTERVAGTVRREEVRVDESARPYDLDQETGEAR
jgi:uncharacterized protein (TIGR02271 family)